MAMDKENEDRIDNIWAYSFRFGEPGQCVYCGNTYKMQIDHVIPISWIFPGRPSYPNAKGITAPACRQCNTTLSNRYFENFAERCEYASNALRRKFAKVMRRDQWDKEELMELKGKLRTYVKNQNETRMAIAEMIEWYGSDAFYRNIRDLAWQPCLDHQSKTYSQSVSDYFEPVLDLAKNFSNES